MEKLRKTRQRTHREGRDRDATNEVRKEGGIYHEAGGA